MAEKALHYDATCHHFMVTSSDQGTHTAAQRQSCHLAGQDPAGFASTWAVFLTNSQPAKLAGKKTCFWLPEQAPLTEKPKGCCQLPRK